MTLSTRILVHAHAAELQFLDGLRNDRLRMPLHMIVAEHMQRLVKEHDLAKEFSELGKKRKGKR